MFSLKKSSFGIIVILIFVALASGCTNQTTQNQTSTKTYAQNGISFQYPSSWLEFPPENLTNKTHIGGVKKIAAVYDTNNIDIWVLVYTVNTTDSVKQIYDDAKNSLNRYGLQLVSESTITVDGATAYQMDYTYTTSIEGKERFVKDRFIIFEKGKIYSLTYSAPVADFDSQLNNFNIIVNSFKVQ